MWCSGGQIDANFPGDILGVEALGRIVRPIAWTIKEKGNHETDQVIPA